MYLFMILQQYFETDATSMSYVLLTPIPAGLEWKFTQIRPGPGEEAYTRYDLKLDEEVRKAAKIKTLTKL